MIALMDGEEFTKEELQVFNEKYLPAMKDLQHVVKMRKNLEEQEKDLKAKLEPVMDKYGIKSIDNDYVKITRIEANPGRQTIDLERMKKEEPGTYEDLLKDYPKTTGKRKAYVRFDTK